MKLSSKLKNQHIYYTHTPKTWKYTEDEEKPEVWILYLKICKRIRYLNTGDVLYIIKKK